MQYINIKEYFKQEKEELREGTPIAPNLLIIDATAGDPGNQIYIRNKVKDFEEMGWSATVRKAEDQYEFNRLINTIYCYTSVIVQMPVMPGINFYYDMIPSNKDCDGLTSKSLVMPATVRGIIDYLDACGFEYKGKTAVVLGRSDIVGKPMAKALMDRDMTVVVCHSKTPEIVRNKMLMDADLVVSAVGKPGLFKRDNCKFDAFVVDVGINRMENGKIVGDFIESPHFKNLSTPVPGGVGLLTRLGLMKNCADLTTHS